MDGWVGGGRERERGGGGHIKKKRESLVVDAARRPEEFILPLFLCLRILQLHTVASSISNVS